MAMPIQPGAFGPDEIKAMGEALDAACKELGDMGQHEMAREVIAGRIIAAARLGERDPIRLREAALCNQGKRHLTPAARPASAHTLFRSAR
jgi:hypothetical protein